MEKKQNKWTLKVNGGGQIADTGDYGDAWYELSNGDVTLVTHDEIDCEVEERHGPTLLEEILNEMGARWYSPKEEEYKIDKQLAEAACKQWKEVATNLYMALKACTPPNYPVSMIKSDAMDRYDVAESTLPG